MAKSQKPVELVKSMLSGFLEENELELYHCEFKKEGKDWYLNIYIDKTRDPETGEERYVGSDDCELVSRYLSDKLDEDDPIEQNYYLQVSSPGLDRQLYEAKDFERFSGKAVNLKLYAPVDGKKEYTGILVGIVDGKIVINSDDKETSFPEEKVVKTCLEVEF